MANGAGTGMYWVFAVLIVAGLALAAGFVGGRFRFRLSWTDAAVVATVILVALSSLHAIDRRPAINLAWEWMAIGVVYLLFRNLPRTRDESSVLAGTLVAVSFAVSVYGLYQASVELPQLQEEYRRNPDQFLLRHRQLGIEPGTREQYLFAQRLLGSNEITSTFALANSLAGFIVGPLVLALAVAIQNLSRRDASGSRWSALAMAAPVGLILLVCLILTKSRSAYLGLLAGLVIVAWESRRQISRRVLLGAGLAGIVLVTALVAIGLATGRLDREVLTESTLSLRYRWEYWQGTWGIVTGGSGSPWKALVSSTSWSGVGPGNFREAYLRHKLPQASEEILDPHNLFFEVWAIGGLGALIALLAALSLGIWNFFVRPSTPIAGEDVTEGSRTDPVPRNRRDDPDAPPRRQTWLVVSAGSGWLLVLALLPLNLFVEGSFPRWVILGASYLTAVLLGAPLWRRLPISPIALGAATVAILINLLAAGGIGIPTVALGLWALFALGLNLRDDRRCGRLREYESRVPSFALATVWAAMIGLFLGAIVPFWRSEAAISDAEEAIRHRPPNFERAENAYKQAITEDRYNVRPWLGYADLQQLIWESRGAKIGDYRWKQIPILLLEANTLPRNPSSWSLHILRADRIRALLQRLGSQLTPIDVVSYGGDIVKETRIATLLYPSSAMLHARLALASAEISMFGDAVKEAEEALRLDTLTPHRDKKLPESLRKRLESQLAEWSSRVRP